MKGILEELFSVGLLSEGSSLSEDDWLYLKSRLKHISCRVFWDLRWGGVGWGRDGEGRGVVGGELGSNCNFKFHNGKPNIKM